MIIEDVSRETWNIETMLLTAFIIINLKIKISPREIIKNLIFCLGNTQKLNFGVGKYSKFKK